MQEYELQYGYCVALKKESGKASRRKQHGNAGDIKAPSRKEQPHAGADGRAPDGHQAGGQPLGEWSFPKLKIPHHKPTLTHYLP